MVRGKGTTERFDKRINIRVSANDWHRIMILAQEKRQKPSAWLRERIGNLLNGKNK